MVDMKLAPLRLRECEENEPGKSAFCIKRSIVLWNILYVMAGMALVENRQFSPLAELAQNSSSKATGQIGEPGDLTKGIYWGF